MKRTIAFLILIGFAATLGAQSLAELARLEKERRKSFGDRQPLVITKLELARVKKKPAVEIVVPAEETVEVLEEGAEAGQEPPSDVETPMPAAVTTPPGEPQPSAAEAALTTEEAAPAGPEAVSPEAEPPLEEQLRAAEELIDLLETKIAALNQDYGAQTNMVPNYVIERQLTETLQKLQGTQAEAVRLRREIDRKALEKRTASGSIR